MSSILRFAVPDTIPPALEKLAWDVMTNGYETGIAYWVNEEPDILNLQATRTEDLDVTVIRFRIIGELILPSKHPDYSREIVRTLDARTILEAMCKLANGEVSVNETIQKVIIDQLISADYCGDKSAGGDAESDDCIIQTALLGKIVYG